MVQLVLCPGSRTREAFNEALRSDLVAKVQITEAKANTRPKSGHLVLVAGRAKASSAVERFAWKLGGYPIYVPECSDWLNHKVALALASGEDLVLVDSALATTGQVDA